MKSLTKKEKQKIKEEIDFKNKMFMTSKDYEIVPETLDFGYLSGYRWFLYSYRTPSLSEIETQIKQLEQIKDMKSIFNTGVYHISRFTQGFSSALIKISWKLRQKNNMDLSMYENFDPSFFEIWN